MSRLPLLAPVLGLLVLAGCNTVAGVGQDLQNAGWALQSEAARNGTPQQGGVTNPVPQPVAPPA